MSPPLLEVAQHAAVREYEQAFYEAFAPLTENRLIRRLWEWDDASRRLRTRVPYTEQVVYLERAGGALTAALAVNVELRLLQAAAYGFALPRPAPPCCEILTFFAVRGRDGAGRARFFWEECGRDLLRRGLRVGYGTCARRPLAGYLRAGAELLAQARIEGEERFFLRLDFEARLAERAGAGSLGTPAA